MSRGTSLQGPGSDLGRLPARWLRREISARGQALGDGFVRETSFGPSASVLFQEKDGAHGNFFPGAWRRIQANPAWSHRLAKVYTASRFVPRAKDRRRRELDCANSSDALLMNIFCSPGVPQRPALCRLLGIEPGISPEFGFRPRIPLIGGRTDRTEIDMRLGSLLVEAKLTEADFQRAPLRLLARYRDVDEVFETGQLPLANGSVHSWQLVRSVLAAHAISGRFVVFCDDRRPDLRERWFQILRAVTSSSLRTRLGFVTWQEISDALPQPLQRFLEQKYGI
jgi:hypothetical protein